MFKSVLLLFLLALLFFLPPFLVKVKVSCKTQYGECPSDINSKLQTVNSKKLPIAKREITKALKGEPLITDYSMQFKLPDIIEVNVLVKKPAFAFKDRTTGKIYAVDEDGQILSEEDDTSLPLLIQDGGEVNPFALKLMSGVFTMYQVRTGEIKNESLVVELPGAVVVIFPVDGDSEILLGSLRLIYARIESDEEKKYSEIDLRFKNPVLR